MTDSSTSSSSSSSKHHQAPEMSPEEKETREMIRSLAEKNLSHNFFTIWQRNANHSVERESNDPEGTKYLTEKERTVLNINTYRSYVFGSVAGATTFGLILGFSVWRRKGKFSLLPLVTDATIVAPKPKRPSNVNLDRISGKRPSLENEKNMMKQKYQNEKAAAETTTTRKGPYTGPSWSTVYSQIELMVAGGLAVIVASAASFWLDYTRMFRNISKLPLESGKSYLCHDACPQLVQCYEATILESKTPTYTWQVLVAENEEQEALLALKQSKLNDFLEQHPLDHLPSDQELWQEPVSKRLEGMVHLVTNCQQRIQYVKDNEVELNERKQQLKQETSSSVSLNLLGTSENEDAEKSDPPDIPAPGIPPTYLGIVVTDDDEDDGDENVNDNSKVREYAPAKKMSW
eukprot:CAMPEP_0198153314 /NCGR_PEP_ID=MMETSP1443-20131203/63579_1 /TAXON_ID=186043 /ORGANISM="Entomoneis sp., Strain CCMP2396" /LENGTH=403 /DNA_ID=CAMNT_0043819605 /DNA_START=61 /DNA_END=1269 /DNA_ORIENTATION=+